MLNRLGHCFNESSGGEYKFLSFKDICSCPPTGAEQKKLKVTAQIRDICTKPLIL